MKKTIRKIGNTLGVIFNKEEIRTNNFVKFGVVEVNEVKESEDKGKD